MLNRADFHQTSMRERKALPDKNEINLKVSSKTITHIMLDK